MLSKPQELGNFQLKLAEVNIHFLDMEIYKITFSACIRFGIKTSGVLAKQQYATKKSTYTISKEYLGSQLNGHHRYLQICRIVIVDRQIGLTLRSPRSQCILYKFRSPTQWTLQIYIIILAKIGTPNQMLLAQDQVLFLTGFQVFNFSGHLCAAQQRPLCISVVKIMYNVRPTRQRSVGEHNSNNYGYGTQITIVAGA